MGAYSYTVSRFVSDPIRDEPVNIGVIVVDPDTGDTAHRFMSRLDSLKARCPGADIDNLSRVVKSAKVGRMPGGADDLAGLARRHRNLLQFTPPRAVEAQTLDGALQDAFGVYVRQTAAEPRAHRQRSKALILDTISKEVRRAGIANDAIKRKPVFAGLLGTFRPDLGVATRIAPIALHVIPFVGRRKKALAEAKVLAIDFEDARAKRKDLECTVVVDEQGQGDESDLYRQASGHLRNKECTVVPSQNMHEYIRKLGDRIRRLGIAGKDGQQELPVHP